MISTRHNATIWTCGIEDGQRLTKYPDFRSSSDFAFVHLSLAWFFLVNMPPSVRWYGMSLQHDGGGSNEGIIASIKPYKLVCHMGLPLPANFWRATTQYIRQGRRTNKYTRVNVDKIWV